jgi:toxin ParE1/3/4
VKLEWSLFAVTDLEKIFDYIEADSPRAAVSMDDRIQDGIEKLLQFPLSGRAGRIDGTRELVISGTPYIAAYRILDETIHILRVLHGTRLWPGQFSDTDT